jgi:hypothetical protein
MREGLPTSFIITGAIPSLLGFKIMVVISLILAFHNKHIYIGTRTVKYVRVFSIMPSVSCLFFAFFLSVAQFFPAKGHTSQKYLTQVITSIHR